MDLKEEDILGADIGKHWYYRSKAAALRRAVGGLAPKRLLDVGAGSGFFSRHLLSESDAQSGFGRLRFGAIEQRVRFGVAMQ